MEAWVILMIFITNLYSIPVINSEWVDQQQSLPFFLDLSSLFSLLIESSVPVFPVREVLEKESSFLSLYLSTFLAIVSNTRSMFVALRAEHSM